MDLVDLCPLTHEELENFFNNMTYAESNLTFEFFKEGHQQMCSNLTFDRVISIVVPIIFAVIVLVGIVGNLLVLVVVLVKQQMRNTTNVLIAVRI